jgi:hypothetical protein
VSLCLGGENNTAVGMEFIDHQDTKTPREGNTEFILEILRFPEASLPWRRSGFSPSSFRLGDEANSVALSLNAFATGLFG